MKVLMKIVNKVLSSVLDVSISKRRKVYGSYWGICKTHEVFPSNKF